MRKRMLFLCVLAFVAASCFAPPGGIIFRYIDGKWTPYEAEYSREVLDAADVQYLQDELNGSE